MSIIPPSTIVCVDARKLAEGTGVAHYAEALAQSLPMLDIIPARLLAMPARSGATGHIGKWFRAIVSRSQRLASVESQGTRAYTGPDIFRVAQVHFDLYGTPLRLRPPEPHGIMHWSYPIPLVVEGWRNLYTVHDLIPLIQPDMTPINGARHRRLLSSLAGAADGIITVSETVRAEIVEELDFDADRIFNCEEPVVLPEPLPIAIPRDYLLVCGSVEPRKNIVRIVEAYARSGVRLPLRIAGPDGWCSAKIRKQTAGVAGVEWLPYQTREMMIALIVGARAVLMPSLAEGFGLPVAEAMSLGTPVVTSEQGALAETAGGAALLVDPLDVAAIGSAIRELAGDPVLVDRLSRAGRERSAAFRPERFAARLEQVYAACLASGGKRA